MIANLFDTSHFGTADEALDFIGGLLESSTEFSIAGIDRAGVILLWSEGARRLYGYEPEEAVGRLNAASLHTPEDVKAGKPREILENAQRDGKWEGTIVQLRKHGQPFTARLVITPRRGHLGETVGFLLLARDISGEIRTCRAEQRLTILHQIDKALIAAEGPEAIAAAALPPLRELLGVPRAVVNLIDLETGEVEWLAAAGRRRVHVGPGVRYSIRLMGDVEALRRGETQWIDVQALPPGPEVDALLASGVHTYVVVPMIAGGELIGALSFGGASGPFSSEQISIAQSAAAQFAIALMQARLHDCIKRQEQELRSAFEDTNVAMVLTDIDNRFIRVNAAFARLFGYSREQMLGMSMADVTYPDDLAESYAQRELLKAGKISHFQIEKRYLHKDGRALWGLTNVSLIRGADGQGLQYVGQVQDITERKRAAEALRENEERLRQLAENLEEVICLSSPDASEILYVSPSYEQVWGRSCASLYADPGSWAESIHPEDRPRVLEAMQRRMTGDLYRQEFRVVRPDGSVRRIRDRAFPIRDGAGNIYRVAGVAVDVTQQLLLEEQLRQAQKMEAIGQLAAGVAHDFNNLLTIINGYSDLLLQSLPDDNPSRKLLDEIRNAGERSASLTRQLLVFSRKQVVAPRVLDLNEVVTNAEKLLCRLIGEDVRLTASLAAELGTVIADQGQIEQVLLNLAVNARDAMPTGGRLTIETQNVDLDDAYTRSHAGVRPGRYVLLAVSDTGTGMTAEVKARIFEPFFTTKALGKGTGLGLATVFGIVKQAEGTVEVYSEPGVGTTFKVYLPRTNRPAPAGKSGLGIKTPPRGTETVLLVEDEVGVRALTRYVLTDCGYTVIEAADGEEALQVAARHPTPVHLLVTDVVMPGVGGRELAERLRPMHPNTKVLFLSGYTDDAVVRHGVLHEEVNFLQKPYSTVALAQKVRDILDAGPDDHRVE